VIFEEQLAVDMNPGSYVNFFVFEYSGRMSITSGPTVPPTTGKSIAGVPSVKDSVASFSAMHFSRIL
jgi:hypothetical protein